MCFVLHLHWLAVFKSTLYSECTYLQEVISTMKTTIRVDEYKRLWWVILSSIQHINHMFVLQAGSTISINTTTRRQAPWTYLMTTVPWCTTARLPSRTAPSPPSSPRFPPSATSSASAWSSATATCSSWTGFTTAVRLSLVPLRFWTLGSEIFGERLQKAVMPALNFQFLKIFSF